MGLLRLAVTAATTARAEGTPTKAEQAITRTSNQKRLLKIRVTSYCRLNASILFYPAYF